MGNRLTMLDAKVMYTLLSWMAGKRVQCMRMQWKPCTSRQNFRVAATPKG